MKRTFLFSVFIISFLLSGCYSKADLEDAYMDGYNSGYSDAKVELDYYAEDDWYEGYQFGHDEASSDFKRIISEAAERARQATGWSIYEAWNSADIYLDKYDPHGHPLPTKEEFEELVRTLILYAEYIEEHNP